RFPAVEDAGNVHAAGGKWRGELRLNLGHGRRRGAAHDVRAVVGGYNDGALGGGEPGQVLLLVGQRAVVEVGPVAEYGDPEPPQRGQGGGNVLSGERNHADSHAAGSWGGAACDAICFSQAARL